MSDFRRGMRAVLPPHWGTCTALLLSYGPRALLEFLTWRTHQASTSDFSLLHDMLEAEPTQDIFAAIPCFVAVIYGLWRVLGRHPVARQRYREWLLRAPWRWPDALPVGPVLPAWQDVIALAVLTVPVLGLPLPWYGPTLAAVLAYGLAALLASLNRDPGITFFAGLWALAAVAYFRETPGLVALGTSVVIISAWRATVASLQAIDQRGELVGAGWSTMPAIDQHGTLGWPYDALAPQQLQRLSTALLVAFAITIGLVPASFRAGRVNDIQPHELAHFVRLAGALFAFARFAMYSTLASSRLNLVRRFRYGRILRLRADSLALSSLTIVLAGLMLPKIVLQLPTTGMNQFAIALSALVALAFCLPPSKESWRLTSDARLSRQTKRSRRRQSKSAAA